MVKIESIGNTNKKIIFSGIKPSGDLTLGNYLGAIKNWAKLQDDYINYFSIVDMHAITVRQDPKELKRRSLEMLAIYIASGLDPEKSKLFIQSHVSAHAELSWVLCCYSMFGELSRMTQFKDESLKNPENINGGLFTYPVLMAADILLYNTNLVPVGADQKQHLELARDVAARFNSVYGNTFVIPEPYIGSTSAKIGSLQEPTKKMSKSETDNDNSYILIMENKDSIIKKFKRAVTDSETVIKYADGKDGINNLMSIYSCITGKNYTEIEDEFAGKGYGTFKVAVGEAVVSELEPVQKKVNELINDKAELEKILKNGAKQASYIANQTLAKVYEKIGFYIL